MKNDPIHDIMLEKLKDKIKNLDAESKTYYEKKLNETKKRQLTPENREFSYYMYIMIFGTTFLFFNFGFIGKILSIFTILIPLLWMIKKNHKGMIEVEKMYELLGFDFVENYKDSIIKYSQNNYCDNKILIKNTNELEKLSTSKDNIKYKLESYFSLKDLDINTNINKIITVKSEKNYENNKIEKIKFKINNKL